MVSNKSDAQVACEQLFEQLCEDYPMWAIDRYFSSVCVRKDHPDDESYIEVVLARKRKPFWIKIPKCVNGVMVRVVLSFGPIETLDVDPAKL